MSRLDIPAIWKHHDDAKDRMAQLFLARKTQKSFQVWRACRKYLFWHRCECPCSLWVLKTSSVKQSTNQRVALLCDDWNWHWHWFDYQRKVCPWDDASGGRSRESAPFRIGEDLIWRFQGSLSVTWQLSGGPLLKCSHVWETQTVKCRRVAKIGGYACHLGPDCFLFGNFLRKSIPDSVSGADHFGGRRNEEKDFVCKNKTRS